MPDDQRAGNWTENDPTNRRFFDFHVTLTPPVSLKRESTAVLVVDMQNRPTAQGKGVSLGLERIAKGSSEYFNQRLKKVVVPGILRLLEYSRANGVAIVYLKLGSPYRDLRDMTPRLREMLGAFATRAGIDDLLDHYWLEHPSCAIRPELAPLPTELVLNKTTFGAFASTNLERRLRERGISSLVITGVSTNCCVETTAREAADRGFGCVIVDEGTADYDAQAHEEALRGFYFNFGRVAHSVEDVIAALEMEASL